jgi:hypothetical protein
MITVWMTPVENNEWVGEPSVFGEFESLAELTLIMGEPDRKEGNLLIYGTFCYSPFRPC